MPKHPAIALPRLIAHRGLSAHAPENTLAAVKAAHEAGYAWVELDVQLLGDGTPVIWHDATLKRCSDGHGRLAMLDLAAVRKLDVGAWFGDGFRGERMATLSDMLALLVELDMGVNMELKVTHRRSGTELAEVVVPRLLKALPPERLILSSFDQPALQHARSLADASLLAIGVLTEGVPATWRTRCEALDAFSLHTDWTRLTARRAREIKDAGYRLLCYTPNDPAAFAPRWEWGVDCAISDDPALFAGIAPPPRL
ncbi:glycerophosphoryl diester phosphodiesterase [Halomonas sp. MCCC 1A17488]|uniref:glycerophosphoryl diester phosphodiesterase n=1 Tax=unclassified Halomonas TaxID=2609666 RepID=UPI0018D235EA|nr:MULTISPECIES: glycerophosphoryl diester phosphodiesterase [unclassified Halomonas]MCE8014551.1 glycerophosphoryl diester phosphodiesterase [Halomonas sp. MCCC 1A17488]MCG3237884.1 glycerophosphoryl diester phosphodiesterase [Halomonas sp. MCCC 1A17488]QPP48327.1 glycerophosphoryl diester phosphodiesterase [Halomonas sp. SS10-MC5]